MGRMTGMTAKIKMIGYTKKSLSTTSHSET